MDSNHRDSLCRRAPDHSVTAPWTNGRGSASTPCMDTNLAKLVDHAITVIDWVLDEIDEYQSTVGPGGFEPPSTRRAIYSRLVSPVTARTRVVE